MKFKWPKISICGIITFFLMWGFGVFLFFSLIYLLADKYQFHFSWDSALTVSVPVGLIWTIIGTALTARDDKIAANRKAISDAVADCFSKTPKF